MIFYIAMAIIYCVLGGGVYRLCKSSDIGRLNQIPVIVMFSWPVLLVVMIFISE